MNRRSLYLLNYPGDTPTLMDYLNPLNYVTPSTKRMVTSLSMEAFAYAIVATSSVVQNAPVLTKNVAYAVNKTAGIAANLYEYTGAADNVNYAARKTTGIAANLVDVIYPVPAVPQAQPIKYYDIPVGTELQGKYLA